MLTFAFCVVTGPGIAAPGLSSDLGWLAGLPVAVPEASSLALLIVGLAVVGVAIRRRHARVAAAGAEVGDDLAAPAPGPRADAR